MSLRPLCVVLALLLAPLPALAQSSRPAANDAAKAETASADTKKAKKPRSEAQKKNDERMRACGTEWRALKASNKTDGKTWRQFSSECRKRKAG